MLYTQLCFYADFDYTNTLGDRLMYLNVDTFLVLLACMRTWPILRSISYTVILLYPKYRTVQCAFVAPLSLIFEDIGAKEVITVIII